MAPAKIIVENPRQAAIVTFVKARRRAGLPPGLGVTTSPKLTTIKVSRPLFKPVLQLRGSADVVFTRKNTYIQLEGYGSSVVLLPKARVGSPDKAGKTVRIFHQRDYQPGGQS